MEAAAWVVSEREMRERLQKEKEAKETREKAEVRFSSSFFSLSACADDCRCVAREEAGCRGGEEGG
jgi:hypothetical protein